MAGVNLVASAFDATLPGYVIPNSRGGSSVLGIVTSCAGIAMIVGSLMVSVLPKPKDRVRVIYRTMLFSAKTLCWHFPENRLCGALVSLLDGFLYRL